MRSSARSLVDSVILTGSGSSTRSMAPRSSVGATRIGESTWPWRLPGTRRSLSSPLLRWDAAGGRPEVAVPSSRAGHVRRPRPGAWKSVPPRSCVVPCWTLWTTSPEPASRRVRDPRRQARSRLSSSFVAKSMASWPSAATSGIRAVVLLVEEAGGRFTDRMGGHRADQGGGLYSNANLHNQLLTSLHYPACP